MEGGRLEPGELARRIEVETPTVVRGVGRMEAAGSVVRRDDERRSGAAEDGSG
jgi:DNA-binding MarR family transcriptional regulator